MSIIIKSFSVGNGDMFYIKHNVDSFSIIDWRGQEGDCGRAEISI